MAARLGWLPIVTVAAALWLAVVDSAQAQSLSTDKNYYQFGEKITITYSAGPEDMGVVTQLVPQVANDQGVYDLEQAVRDQSGTIEYTKLTVLPDFVDPTEGADPSRRYVRITLRGKLGNGKIALERWIVIVHRTPPATGALALSKNNLVVGESLDVTLRNIDALRHDNTNPRNNSPHLLVRLYRLGHALPGGAAIADERIRDWSVAEGSDHFTIGYGPEFGSALNQGVGIYELRLIGMAEAILDRQRFRVELPAKPGSLSLSPASSAPYPYSAPPKVLAGIDTALLSRIGEGNGVWPRVAAYSVFDDVPALRNYSDGSDLVGNVQSGNTALDLLYTSGGLRPGPYVAELQAKVPGYPIGRFVVFDRQAFFLSGDYPAAYADQSQGPPVAFGAVKVALEPGGEVAVGAMLHGRATFPSGANPLTRAAWAEVFPADSFGFGCAWLRSDDSEFQIGKLPLAADGSFAFRAPPSPGRWEVRILENRVKGAPAPLARAIFQTTMPSLPGAIALSGGNLKVGDPIALRIAVPADFLFEKFKVQLWRSAERLPGGAERAPYLVATRDLDARSGSLAFEPLWAAGPYEVRLVTDLFVLARQAFDVTETRGPRLEPGDEPRRSTVADDLPNDADASRGLDTWYPDLKSCSAQPAAATASTQPATNQPAPAVKVRLVEWLGGDPETDKDDSYQSADQVFAGYPYQVEAYFASPPGDDHVSVSVAGTVVQLERSTDPHTYRSRPIVFVGGPSP